MRKSKTYTPEQYEDLLRLLESEGYKKGSFLKDLDYHNNMIKDHVRLNYSPVVYNVMFEFPKKDMANFFEDEPPIGAIAEWRYSMEDPI